MMQMGKDFVGRALSQREALLEPDRLALVGIKPVDPSARITAGAHFLALKAEPRAENDEGHVTSVGFSPSLNSPVGLGLLRRGRERIGETLRAHDAVRRMDVRVEICATPFIDPEGARLRG
jgi:sarcosine oxidase subunit alpha